MQTFQNQYYQYRRKIPRRERTMYMLNPEVEQTPLFGNYMSFQARSLMNNLAKESAINDENVMETGSIIESENEINAIGEMEEYIAEVSRKLLEAGSLDDLSRMPLGVDEFLYKAHFEERRLKNDASRAEKFNNTDMFYAGPVHAGEIISLHNEIYNGQYPYREMLDEDYVKNALKNDCNAKNSCNAQDDEPESDRLIAALFKLKNDPKNAVAGCAMLQLSPKKRRGYMRGLIIRPQYRNKIDIKKIFVKELQKHYYNFKDKLDMWYSEGRTSHSIAQFMMHYTGSVTCGILPNKDDFFGTGKRESDALMVGYYLSAFEKRRKHPQLLPAFRKLYKVMQRRFNLEDASILLPDGAGLFPPEGGLLIDKARTLTEHADIEKIPDKYGNIEYNISLPTGAHVSFVLNTNVMSAEGFKAEFENIGEFISLFMAVKDIAGSDGIKYLEYYLPAYSVIYQQILLDLGFSVFGYVPAWHEDSDGSLSDCILFGISSEPLDPRELDLTGSSREIFRCVKPFLNLKKRERNEKKTEDISKIVKSVQNN